MATTNEPQNPDNISVFTDRPIPPQRYQLLVHECHLLRIRIFATLQKSHALI
jgi:hypothetical protein